MPSMENILICLALGFLGIQLGRALYVMGLVMYAGYLDPEGAARTHLDLTCAPGTANSVLGPRSKYCDCVKPAGTIGIGCCTKCRRTI